MKHYKRHLIATAAVCILGVSATVVNAETVTTKTVVSTKHLNGVDRVNFASFDLNGDGILSMSEVGERLFYAFDMDGNEVIDNIEMNKKSVMTIIPMEKQTFKFVDDNNDGKTDEGAYTYETFIEKSKLMRFDKDMDGLSPSEFIGETLLKLDDNDSGMIELDEWKEAYTAMLHKPNAEQERYN
jgi:hypothetical protein